jgi:hypothetical protein
LCKGAVEAVIGKAMLDVNFRAELLADADQALAGFDLTPAEIIGLKRLDGETLDRLANLLDEQKTKLHLEQMI